MFFAMNKNPKKKKSCDCSCLVNLQKSVSQSQYGFATKNTFLPKFQVEPALLCSALLWLWLNPVCARIGQQN